MSDGSAKDRASCSVWLRVKPAKQEATIWDYMWAKAVGRQAHRDRVIGRRFTIEATVVDRWTCTSGAAGMSEPYGDCN